MPPSPPRTFSRSFLLVGLLLGTAVACFWPLFRHPADLIVGTQRAGLNDLITWYLPRREYPQLTLSQFGQLPFWCPWVAGGVPFLGSFQTAVFYPPNWIFWVFPARGIISWTFVAHHLVAAIGAYLLGRQLGAKALGASFAAVTFGVSPILLARTGEGHLTILSTVAWYPWAFLAYEWLRAGRRGAGLAVVLVMALGFLAGHPQEFYYLVVILTTICGCDVAGHMLRRQVKLGLSLGLRWGLAGLTTLALVAAELIPLGIYLGQASSEARLKMGSPLTASTPNLVQLVLPFFLGTPASYGGPGMFFWETLCYFGLIPLVAAVNGLVAGLQARRPVCRLVVPGIVAFALSFGEATPLHGILGSWLPGYAQLRCPGRWLMMTALAVASLAAFGLDDLARPRSEWKGRLAWSISLITLAFGLSFFLAIFAYSLLGSPGGNVPDPSFPLFTTPRTSLWQFLAAPMILVVGLVCAALARLRPRLATGFAGLLVAGTVAEFAIFANTILTSISPENFPREQPVVAILANRLDGTRVFGSQIGFTDDESFRSRLRKFQGYEPIPLDRTVRFLGLMLNPRYPTGSLEGFLKFDLLNAPYPGLLDLWAARDFVVAENEDLPKRAIDWRDLGSVTITWVTTARDKQRVMFPFRLKENPDAIPRGFVIGLVKAARPGNEEVDALRTLDPRREVILERDVLSPGPRQEFTPARRIEDTPNRVVLEFETIHPGYLVLADSWYPGWTATLDGSPVPIFPADVAFRAVAVPEPGKHRVVFTYFPPGLVSGLSISGVTVLALTVLTIRPGWMGIRRKP